MAAHERMAGMKRLWISWGAHVALLLMCICNAAQLLAQQPKGGRVSGHVVDEIGAMIKGASVLVRKRSPSDDSARVMTHTDLKGNFTLDLPEGAYDLLVASPAFATAVQTIAVSAGKTSTTLWKLAVLSCDFSGMNCDTAMP